jgi:hypothetical protein
MLAAPLLMQHTFSVHFARLASMRRMVNVLEDALAEGCPGGYASPQTIPIPDEMGPDVPRVIFNSLNGFSTIAISQTAMALSINYSDDWQVGRLRCVDYLKHRAHVLFDMVGKLGVSPSFVGIGTRLRVMSDSNDADEVMAAMRTLVSPDIDLAHANEILLRFSNDVNGEFFSNLTIANASVWPDMESMLGRFPKASRQAIGIEITGDFNNRLAYNEVESHKATLEGSLAMIDEAAYSAYGMAGRFRGDHA